MEFGRIPLDVILEELEADDHGKTAHHDQEGREEDQKDPPQFELLLAVDPQDVGGLRRPLDAEYFPLENQVFASPPEQLLDAHLQFIEHADFLLPEMLQDLLAFLLIVQFDDAART